MSIIILFEERHVRRAWNEAEEKWYFAIADVIAVLTESVDPGAYWRKLKERLKQEGNQSVTNCHALKMTAADGKQRLTDAQGFPANQQAARLGGTIAGNARLELETESGTQVSTPENFKALSQREAKRLNVRKTT